MAKRGGGSVNGEGLPQPMITPPPQHTHPMWAQGDQSSKFSGESRSQKSVSRLFSHCLNVDKSLFKCKNGPIESVDNVIYFTVVCDSKQLSTAISEKWVKNLGPATQWNPMHRKVPCAHLMWNGRVPALVNRQGAERHARRATVFWKLEYRSPHSPAGIKSPWRGTLGALRIGCLEPGVGERLTS